MTVLVEVGRCQFCDHFFSKADGGVMTHVTTSVNIECYTISESHISHTLIPHFEFFTGMYCLKKNPALVACHGFINTQITARIEVWFERWEDEVNEIWNFEERVILQTVGCVAQVKVLVQFQEPCFWHHATDPGIVETFVSRPAAPKTGLSFDVHRDQNQQVRSHFFRRSLSAKWARCALCRSLLFCKPVCFLGCWFEKKF